jgi:hypothetical protein
VAALEGAGDYFDEGRGRDFPYFALFFFFQADSSAGLF